MKQNIYRVWFKNRMLEIVYAFNAKEAKIVAQANRIHAGLNYKVLRVEKVNID